MKKTLIIILAVLLVVGATYWVKQIDNGEYDHMHEMSLEMQKIDVEIMNIDDVELSAGYAAVQVNGLVCPLCAKKAEKGLMKLSFVKNVMVDLENQMIAINVEEGKTINAKSLARNIRKSGFNPLVLYSLDDEGKVMMTKL